MSTSSLPVTPGRASGTARYGGHPAITLSVIVLCQFMVGLDGTVVNIALPKIHAALGFSPTGLAWVVSIYLLTFGGFLLLGGRIGDILGRRRLLVAGLVIFAAASMAGGLATSVGWLLSARAVQGIGAALAAPSALALVTNNFPEGPERNRALGAVAGSYAGSLVLGLIAGGMLVLWASWRWVLFINVPIAVLELILAPLFINEAERHAGKFDLLGALLSVAGMSSLVYGFLHAASSGWDSTVTVVSFVAAIVLLATFLVVELRAEQPVVPLGLFTARNRSAGLANLLVLGAPMAAMLFFVTQLLQNVRSFSPLTAGLAFLPMATGLMGAGGIAAQLLKRVSPRTAVFAGSGLLAGGMIWLAMVSPATSYAAGVLGPTIMFGAGAGVAFTALNSVILSGVSARESGAASSLLESMNWVGASLGLSVLVTVFGTARRHAAAHLPAGLSRPAANYLLVHGMSAAFVGSLVFIGGGFLITIFVLTGARPAPGATRDSETAAGNAAGAAAV